MKNHNQIICIFNYFSTNSTYMKKGSVTSKLKSSFFVQSKFNNSGRVNCHGTLIPLLLFNAPGTLLYNWFCMCANVNKS